MNIDCQIDWLAITHSPLLVQGLFFCHPLTSSLLLLRPPHVRVLFIRFSELSG
nr:MAG TPA: hypothetical protein [Caudoviricetes sp.]